MSEHSATYEVTIRSPHGQQAVEEFRHFLNKVASEAKERWNIEIEIARQKEEPEHDAEFNQ